MSGQEERSKRADGCGAQRDAEASQLHERATHRQRGVDGEHDELRHTRSERFDPVVQDLARRIDFLLPGQKDEYVPRGLREVNLHHGEQRRLDVVGLARLNEEKKKKDTEDEQTKE